MTDFTNTPELSKSTEPAISYSTCYDQCFSDVYNMDCIELMKKYTDNYFDLAIVDPPYGMIKNTYGSGKVAPAKFRCDKINHREWDIAPNKEYFNELKRVSKNQIVWGANHFISSLPFDSSCWLVWDKDNTGDFADCELAWTSFNTAVRKFEFRWNGMLQGDMKNKETKIHPTQKPVRLYDWILKNYAKEHQIILDTHLGSGSSRIAANKAGVSFIGCEINKDYFDKSQKRYDDFISQQRLF